MSCSHAETTTLLWAYGEGPEDHAEHVATCAACQDVVAMHEFVGAEVAPILPILRRLDDEVQPEPVVRHPRWGRWVLAVGVLAAGLALMVGFGTRESGPSTPTMAVEPDAPVDVVLSPVYGSLDRELDELDDLVDTLASDASIL